MKRFFRVFSLLSLALLLSFLSARLCLGEELELTLDEAEETPPGEPAAAEGTGYLFRLAPFSSPEADLSPLLFWRERPSSTAASTTLILLQVDGEDIISPTKRLDERPWRMDTLYPIAGRKEVTEGKHRITPGDMEFHIERGTLRTDHPALRWNEEAETVTILCVPVRFERVNGKGYPVAGPIEIILGQDRILRSAPAYNPLIAWLPIGQTYSTTLGQFSITAEGAITPVRLAGGVEITPAGLLQRVTPEASTFIPGRIRFTGGANEGELVAFLTPQVKPGTPLHLAFVDSQVKQFFSPGEKEFVLTGGLDRGKVRAAGTVSLETFPDSKGATLPEAPSTELAAAAAAALGAAPEALVWYALPLDPTAFGLVPVTLRLNESRGQASVLVQDVEGSSILLSHRNRRVFHAGERPAFSLLMPGNFPGGAMEVKAQASGKGTVPLTLGNLTLPKGAGEVYDSRSFLLDLAVLPAGSYTLWLEGAGGRSSTLPLTLVPWTVRSGFFLHSMSCCTDLWPSDQLGLKRLQGMGYEMLTVASGHGGSINGAMPVLDQSLPLALRLPPDLGLVRQYNDYVYENFLSAGLRHVDNTVLRERGWYLESLSYHHSYQPDVDRMIRRMQIFTQQTADYPSFYGTNFSWFPALGGYAEGGVPTDAHVQDRNSALEEKLKAAGVIPAIVLGEASPPPGQRSRYEEYKKSGKPEEREQAQAWLAERIRYWEGQQDYGFGRHNQIYTDAIRQVRPETVTTLFENAGHDGSVKRTRDLFRGMVGATYESYTDYGEWPMSPAFTTDWARAELPGKEVWVTMDWGCTTESLPKSLLHAFARGLTGGGFPMQADAGTEVLARRGRAIRFFQQYGGLTGKAVPDGRFGLLTTLSKKVMDDRAYYNYHALYYHLTRLGAPPRLLPEEQFQESGIPPSVRVLFIAQQDQPWDPKTLAMISAFQAAGGKVVETSDSTFPVEGALKAAGALKDIWELSGFNPKAHQDLWQEFTSVWQAPLTAALEACGVPRFAATDPEKALVLGMEAGPVRYVAVLSDLKDSHAKDIRALEGLVVSLEGEGWKVRDLVKQIDLTPSPAKGRTEVSLDLVNEPATLLALYSHAPAAVVLEAGGEIRLGGRMAYQVKVIDEAGAELGAVPVRFSLVNAAGLEEEVIYRAAGTVQHWSFPALATAGEWKLRCEELLTGRSALLVLPVAPALAAPLAATLVPEVHQVNEAHLQEYTNLRRPIQVLLEAGQESLRPLAETIVAGLKKRKIEARLVEIKPEMIDGMPQRWYPREEDMARQEAIARGELVGYRVDLVPYIDEKNRVHIPDRGGYAAIQPPYIVGDDCVVFSGGALCESLRAVSPWLPTPTIPGRGQGRLLIAFSPFMAGRHCAALLGNDPEGMERAGAAFLAAYDRVPSAGTAGEPAPAVEMVLAAKGVEASPVPTPFVNYIPTRRVERLLVNGKGNAAVFLKGKGDNLVFLGADGKTKGSVTLPGINVKRASFDQEGRVWDLKTTVTGTHPGWGFPTGSDFVLQAVTAEGQMAKRLLAYRGSIENLPPNHSEGLLIGPAGDWALLARRGGFFHGSLAGPEAWTWVDDAPNTRDRWEIRTPRWPVGAVASGDGRYILCTMDTRPRLGGMGVNQPSPTSCTTLLFDRRENRLLWKKRSQDASESAYALFSGFGAVAETGRVAMVDYIGRGRVIEPSGTEIFSEQLTDAGSARDNRSGPVNGVGVQINATGTLAVFAFRTSLTILDLTPAVPVAVTRRSDLLLTADVAGNGMSVFTGLESGQVKSFSPSGEERWSASPGGIDTRVAAVGEDEVVVASSEGEVVRYANDGKELWRVSAVALADKGRHPVTTPDGLETLQPFTYREPGTLALARERLKAESLAEWKPAGEAVAAFGQTFYPVTGVLTLKAEAPEAFLHLVYRRPDDNKSLKVITTGTGGAETFWLDLPTSEYRVIDIPVRGPQIAVEVVSEGPVLVAAAVLYSLHWPGANLAFVRPAGADLAGAGGLGDENAGDNEGLGDLSLEDDGSTMAGEMKDCALYSWNPDPDQVSGPWLRVPVPPLAVVDGKRFGNGTLIPMTSTKGSYRGVWWTMTFPQPVRPKVVAWYDRANRQSQVAIHLSVFTAFDPGLVNSGRILTGVVESDQFWRLLPIPAADPLTQVGVQVYKGDSEVEGISEVEIY